MVFTIFGNFLICHKSIRMTGWKVTFFVMVWNKRSVCPAQEAFSAEKMPIGGQPNRPDSAGNEKKASGAGPSLAKPFSGQPDGPAVDDLIC
jgi:hypothetical protein